MFGGFNGQQYLNSVERFDPHSGHWEFVAGMPTNRAGAEAVVVDGKVYVAGGFNGTFLNALEMFESPKKQKKMI